MQFFQQGSKRHAVYAFAEQALPPIDLHKDMKRSGRATEIRDLFAGRQTTATRIQTARSIPKDFQQQAEGSESTPVTKKLQIASSMIEGQDAPGQTVLDFGTWLPYCAPHYEISGKLEDHILTPVVVMPADIPNRNSVAFPLAELVKFHPHIGQQAFKSWRGKPTHHEHDNEDITRAYGVIADSYLRRLQGFGNNNIWKVLLLLSFDRSKHPDVAEEVLSGQRNSYSMGAWVGSYTCSICGSVVGECSHISTEGHHEMYALNDELVFRNCVDIEGFECSQVATPAYISAISDVKHDLKLRPGGEL